MNPQAERYAYELRLAIFGDTREVGRVQYVSAQIVHPLNSNLIHKHLHVVVVITTSLPVKVDTCSMNSKVLIK